MTALELIARKCAEVQYDRARREHERRALLAYRKGQPLTGYIQSAAVKRLARRATEELTVVSEIGR